MNKKNILKGIVAVAVVLAFMLPGSAVFANFERDNQLKITENEFRVSADTIVSIDPSTQNVEKGETFTVDVFVEPGEPIIAVNVNLLSFDPTLIQANSVTEGDLFEGLNTFFIPGTIDNVNGTISLISVVTIPATGVSDPGTFCIIEFTALDQFGTSMLDLEGVEASDEFGNPVSVIVNDGSVTVGTNQPPPYQPRNPDPYDGETDVDINADLSWTGGDPNPGDTVTYDVYFGIISPPPIVESNQSETMYDPGTMSQNTTYYWQIVAWDNHGAFTEGLIWDFITEDIDWWPMHRHDLANTGYSTSSAPNTNNVLWNYTAGGRVSATPAVVDGRIFFGTLDEYKFYCLDESDGSFIWDYTMDYKHIATSSTVADGKVYFGARYPPDFGIYCLNIADGSEVWKKLDVDMTGNLIIADGKLYFGSIDYNVYCLNATDGSEIWSYPTDNAVYSSPAVVDGRVFIGSYDKKLYCLDASNGSLIWSYRAGDKGITDTPTVVDGRVFFSSPVDRYYSYIHCLNASDGSLIWQIISPQYIHYSYSFAITNGKIFISTLGGGTGSADHAVYCLNASDGSEIWCYTNAGAYYMIPPSIADGKVYFGSQDKNIYCLNASDGSLIWKHATDPIFIQGGYTFGGNIAIANGKLFVGSEDKNLYCFGLFQGHDVRIENMDDIVTGPLDIIAPEISVQNCGIYNEIDVPVNLQITKTGTGNVEYNETVIIDIDSEETKIVTFPDWMPEDIDISGSVKYNVMVCNQLSIDENPSNDDETKAIALYSDDIDWWPMFHHDLANTGYSTSTGPETNNVLWRFDLWSTIQSSLVVANGRIFFGLYDGMFFCLDAFDGSFIWKYAVSNHVVSSPAVSDGKVYFVSDEKIYGYFNCLNEQDGSLIWRYELTSHYFGAPAVADGKVFFGGCCLNATDGSFIWKYDGYACSSPAVVDGKVYINDFWNNILLCLNATDGSEIWNYSIGIIDNLDSSPAVVDGKIYVGSDNGSIYCLNARDGSFIWSSYLGGMVESSPAVVDGKVYVGSMRDNIHDDAVHCLNATDGSEIWNYAIIPGPIVYSSPAVADGKVYIGSGDQGTKNFHCLDAQDGSLIWDYASPMSIMARSSPAVADGKVYIGTSGTCPYIYCFGPPDHDVGVTSIDSPVSGPAGIFTPEVTVENFGFNNELDMPVSMRINKINDAWIEVLFSGTGHWEQMDYASGGPVPDGTGSYFAIADSYAHASNVFDVGLITPSLDLSGLSSVTLEFEMFFARRHTDWAEVNVYSGGVLEENLATYTSYIKKHESLTFNPSGYTNPSEVYIEFYYSTGGETYQFGFAIDDVIINEIEFSEGFELSIFPPVAVEPIPEYNETATIDINIGESKSVTFPDWTPVGSGIIDYLITASTQLVNDGEPRNDCKAEVITLDWGISTIVSIDPPTQNVEKGETFTVDVFVEPGEPIIAVTVDLLSFDPMLIQANSVTEGDLFEGLNTFFIPGTIDNVNGTISLISVVTIPATGVSDPGTFCTIEFTALDQSGTSVLDLEGVEASDELGNPVSIIVNDGSVTVGTNQPPYQPSDPDPYDGEINVDIDADLSWTGGDPNPGDTVTYDVYFGTTSPPPIIESNQSETTYDPRTMNQNTKYYWQIVAWDNHGLCTESPIWTFTTEEEMPEIEIEISGGFGVNAIIRNIGDTDITDLNWKIMANGGFILFGREKTGIIDFLLAGEEDKIRSVPFGFGRIQICVTAECEETIDKFLLGVFILPR